MTQEERINMLEEQLKALEGKFELMQVALLRLQQQPSATVVGAGPIPINALTGFQPALIPADVKEEVKIPYYDAITGELRYAMVMPGTSTFEGPTKL